jgi:hypothetical protein
MNIVELIVAEIRKRSSELTRLFYVPGRLIIHIDPRDKAKPVKLEVQVNLG